MKVRRLAERKEREAARRAKLEYYRGPGVHVRTIEGGRAPQGLDKSCYGPCTRSFASQVWLDGVKVSEHDTTSAAQAAADMLRNGAKTRRAKECVADGLSLKSKDLLLSGVGFNPHKFE